MTTGATHSWAVRILTCLFVHQPADNNTMDTGGEEKWREDVHSARNEFYLHAGVEKTMQLLECAHFIGVETMLELQQRTFLDYFDKIYNADKCQRHAQRQACDVLLSIMDMVH